MDLMHLHVNEQNENVVFAKRKATQNPTVKNLKHWTEVDLQQLHFICYFFIKEF